MSQQFCESTVSCREHGEVAPLSSVSQVILDFTKRKVLK